MTAPALAPDQTPVRPKRPLRPRLVRWGLASAVVIPVLWSALGLEISVEQLKSAPADMWAIFRLMVPPDLSPEAIERALPKIMESLWIAWIGTIIGAFFSFFLAFAAATNVTSRRFSTGVRQILNAIRAIPELLVAMILYRTCFSSALVAITSSSHSRTLLTCQRASTHSSRLKLQCSEHELEMVMDPLDLRLYFENLT